MIPLAKGFVQIFLFLRCCKRISLVQIRQNLDGILFSAQVSKDPIERLLDIQRLHLNLVTVKCHEIWLNAKGTSLVETTTT